MIPAVERYWEIRKAIQPYVDPKTATPDALARMNSHPPELLAMVAALLTVADALSRSTE